MHKPLAVTLAGALLSAPLSSAPASATQARPITPSPGPSLSPSTSPSPGASFSLFGPNPFIPGPGASFGHAGPAPSADPAPSPSPTPSPAPCGTERTETLPSGKATATSFWDAATASGKPMRYQTIASPYWPLGTRVKITYKGRSVIGVIEDFGPAEWAVAQHNPPAIVDLSEKMMADLTGVRSNSVTVHFEVLKWGNGRVYRRSGTGYDLAMGRS